MKSVLFVLVIIAFVQGVILPSTVSILTGLTIENAIIYLVALGIMVTEGTDGSLRPGRVPNFWLLVFIVVCTLASAFFFFYHVLPGLPELSSGKTASLLDVLRKAKGLVLQPILLFMIPFFLVDTARRAEQFLYIYVIVVGVLNVLSVFADMANIQLFHVYEFYEDLGRFAGITGNPNKTAYLVCFLIPFQYYLFKKNTSNATRLLLMALMLGEVASIFLSGSRGGIIVLAMIGLALIHIYKDYKILMFLIPLGFLGIAFGLRDGGYLQEAFERTNILISGDLETASSGRFDIWKALLIYFFDNHRLMLFGSGFGAVEFVGTGFRAHNLYMEILIEFGFAGILIFGLLIKRTYSYLLTLNNDEFELKRIIIISMFAVLIAWFFTTLIGVLQLITLGFATALSLLKCINYENKYDPNISKETEADTTPVKTSRILRYKKS